MGVSESIRMKRAVRQHAQLSIPEDVVHHILIAGRRALRPIVRTTL
jgi:hypothetical protein